MKLKKTFAFLLALTTLGAQLAVPANSADLFGDINGDGAINALDAASILQYAAYAGAGGKLDLKGFLNGEEEPQVPVTPPEEDDPVTPPAEEDSTLTILSWNSDTEMMVEYYQEMHPDADIKIITVEDAELAYRDYLLSGEQVDLYVADPSWIASYINDPKLAQPLSAVGITEADYAKAFPYTLQMGKNKKGELYAATPYVCPGGYCYNTDLAMEYLGISTPEEMQAAVSDWNGFLMTADKLHKATDGGVTMVASIGDIVTTYAGNGDMPALIDGEPNMEKAGALAKLVKECTDKGYVNPNVMQWTIDWTNVGLGEETMGYFYSSWCLYPYGVLESNCGSVGNWAIVEGPQSYYWGGMAFCVAPSCNSASMAEDFLRCLTVDTDSMENFADSSGFMVNNCDAIENIMASGEHGNPLLGGQDEYSVLYNTAKNLDFKALTEHDDDLMYLIPSIIRQNPTFTEEELMKQYAAEAHYILNPES